ncbi:flavin containing amine oxidoreductase [Phlyctema vagabunda]|uniref:Flavin containing amine oxidoreductase n=1 Tax=Phlyctema vagabunda TaxID=108571 RepID=A0ABR4P6S1_9HELO
MATTLDTQSHQDSLSHDTLMGLQELDSHLSMFDTSNLGRESSTPDAISNSAFEDAIKTVEGPPSMILVDPPDQDFSPDFGSDADVDLPAESLDNVEYDSIIVSKPSYVPALQRRKHLKPGSVRDSLASSMVTDMSESSSLSSISSKETSPTLGESRQSSKRSSNSKRPKYNVRPKVSIPTDIHPTEYARQCISAAESSRLNPYSLHPEEHAMLRKYISHQQVTTYLNVRNGILRLWTRNPLIRVTRDEAIGCAKDTRWFDVASICHEWLSRRGYINYGCLEHVEDNKPAKRAKPMKRKQRIIAVIGAGMAGLGCARQLEGLVSQFEDRFRELGEDPPRVVVLEGRDRVGGRVYSRALKSHTTGSSPLLGYGNRKTAEMGGMIITGFDRGNPLNIIVRGQLALQYHALRSETTIYDANGRPVDIDRDLHAEKLFNYILERVSEYKFKIPIPTSADGDKEAVDAGRDSAKEGSRTISEVEDAGASPPSTSGNGQESKEDLQMVPVSSDRLTGRAHIEPGIPAVHTAAYKAKEIGWSLRPSVGIEQDLDLESAVNSKYATFGSVFDEALRQFERFIDLTPLDLRLINWHVANLEYSNAITINKLSLGGWDLDAGNEWEGKHTMVTGGYQQVPRGLLNCPQPLSVQKKAVVKSIIYHPDSKDNNSPSKIICENGECIEADYIVSTLPLGVLKQKDIKFEPALPDWKNGPISRLGFGVLNKMVFVFEQPFWDTSRDIFGTLRDPPDCDSLNQSEYFSKRGRFFQWFNCTKTTGLPTLLALMAGDAAFHTEETSNDVLVAEAMQVLRSVFGSHVPAPTEFVVTRWRKDEFARGSYSYTGPTFQPNDYDDMAKPIGNLFFAGEHTCGTHPATVHGAYISGLRAASEVLETILGPIPIPEPLIMPKDSNSKRKAAEAASLPQDPKLARLEKYENEVWLATVAKFGERPFRPSNSGPNPYRMFCKDKWNEAKQRCNEGRRPGKGKPIRNEVKTMVTSMWRSLTNDEKKPYEERADVEKKAYQAAHAAWVESDGQWVKGVTQFREEYMRDHPSVPGPDEDPFSEERRNRRAKRISDYKEPDDDDDLE